MSWVRAHVGESLEVRVPVAGKPVWVKADGSGSAPLARVVPGPTEEDPPSTWLVPAFDLPSP
ncbi:hypothetical protein L3Q67_08325 [Saccharothrix sp. AJ9571]|nr:hypothetical protein L3Q67_08325 [Saccharothrix sp. AJ9571]